jgi:hypothetical protein
MWWNLTMGLDGLKLPTIVVERGLSRLRTLKMILPIQVLRPEHHCLKEVLGNMVIIYHLAYDAGLLRSQCELYIPTMRRVKMSFRSKKVSSSSSRVAQREVSTMAMVGGKVHDFCFVLSLFMPSISQVLPQKAGRGYSLATTWVIFLLSSDEKT